MMRMIRSLALAAAGLAGLLGCSDDSAEPVLTAAPILDRAVRELGGIEEGALYSEGLRITTRLGGSAPVASRTSHYAALRKPGLSFSSRMDNQAQRFLSWSDGNRRQDFSIGYPPDGNGEPRMSHRSLLPGEYAMVGRHKFNRQSPFYGMTQGIELLTDSDETYPGARYAGTRTLREALCDVIEIERDDPLWSETRKHYPDAPPEGRYFTRIFIRRSDGLPLRMEHLGWAILESEGKWPEPPHSNARVQAWENYFYTEPPPAEEFSWSNFEADVRGALGSGKAIPQSVQASNDWQGRTMPSLELTTLDDKPVRWEDFAGQVLVVETWFIGCAYCKSAFPFYDKMRARLEDRGVRFMTVNTGDAATNSASQIEAWRRRHAQAFKFLWTRSTHSYLEVGKELGSLSAPLFFVIGADGKVVANYEGFDYGQGGEDPRLLAALARAGVKP